MSYDIRLSYTSLNVLRKCRYRFFLQYVKKLVDWDKIDQRPFIVGKIADWLFQKWIERSYPQGWMEYKADEMFDWFATKNRIVYKSRGDKDKLKFKLRNASRRMENSAFNWKLPDRRMMLQKKAYCTHDGFDFSGKLDLWFPEENLIWDLKITENKRYLDAFQLYVFAWIMEKSDHEIKKLGFFSPMMRRDLYEYDWTHVERHQFEQELFELLELIRSNSWEQTAKDCWGCPVRSLCEVAVEVESFQKNKEGGFTFDV